MKHIKEAIYILRTVSSLRNQALTNNEVDSQLKSVGLG